MSSRILLVLALGGAAVAAERARVLDLRATTDPSHSIVEVIGDRPLSFTTMRLAAPPRVVVDVADAEVEAKELEVSDGIVKRVASAAAGARTARVVIELVAEAEFEVHAEGDRIAVRFARTAVARADADAQTRASLPTVSIVGSKPVEPAAEPSAEAPPSSPERKPAVARTAKKPADKKGPPGGEASRRLPGQVAKASPPGITSPQARTPRQLAMAAASRSITSIGFRPTEGGAVIVRSDRPLEASVSGEPGAILLHLPQTAIPVANNRRPLDTRFFDGPVQRVVPLLVPGGTDVRIEVRGHADYQLEQSGSVLTVTFARP